MYPINEYSAAVKQLQTYLLTISYRDEIPYMPHISIDGIYGENTRTAVMDFQKKYGIPATGIVNYETWQAIYSVYKYGKKYP
ncbi:MAG: peptidoglycan-binding domain-containing protein [Eubacteriales bacterium]|nr:peptidoglycan-binding domain-containing protein [Eubacteriales bacterium]